MGLATLIRTVPEMEVVGEAASPDEAVELVERVNPDIVLMDVRLRAGSGVQACREIRSRRPATRVVMLTSFSDEEAVIASLLAGASGYLIKDDEPERLIEAIETVARGGSLLDASAVETLLAWMRREGAIPRPGPLGQLSVHERRNPPPICEGEDKHQNADSPP